MEQGNEQQLMPKKKYECCGESFADFKEYITHLNTHKEALVDVPEPMKKPSLLKRLLTRKKKDIESKPEVVSMVEKEGEKPDANEARFAQIEGAVHQVTNMMGKLNDKLEEMTNQPAVQELVVPSSLGDDAPAQAPAKVVSEKKLKITVTVPEKESGEFLKLIQGDDNRYEMEAIEFVKGVK
ncbi:hypothetical protein ACFL96_13420 [Thermoproteota archaeon]